ncbi:receptor-like kinase LIP1 [Populus nigra]|uniref:receptor-like kinase LIP1 n=1 Tax=Populus nigra TaxID=3691 RepID=UPI002B273395|nr:receptor-like kinase LIP1 [Populus nigra]
MSPEYAIRRTMTAKADVYSFGILLLEIVSGRNNAEYREKEETVVLLDTAANLRARGTLGDLVDSRLGRNYDGNQTNIVLNLAMMCTDQSPSLRPTMSQVVANSLSLINNRLQHFLPSAAHRRLPLTDRLLRPTVSLTGQQQSFFLHQQTPRTTATRPTTAATNRSEDHRRATNPDSFSSDLQPSRWQQATAALAPDEEGKSDWEMHRRYGREEKKETIPIQQLAGLRRRRRVGQRAAACSDGTKANSLSLINNRLQHFLPSAAHRRLPLTDRLLRPTVSLTGQQQSFFLHQQTPRTTATRPTTAATNRSEDHRRATNPDSFSSDLQPSRWQQATAALAPDEEGKSDWEMHRRYGREEKKETIPIQQLAGLRRRRRVGQRAAACSDGTKAVQHCSR